jgi:hypothetical protein
MKDKTYKREFAFFLFMWLVYLVETKEPEVVKILTFPIFTFGALAFGMSWYAPNGGLLRQSPQSSYGGRAERGSQRTGWEDQQSDSRDYQRHGTEASKAECEEHQPDSRQQQSKV